MAKQSNEKILRKWVIAAQEFTAGKKQFLKFVEATIHTYSDLWMKGWFRDKEYDYAYKHAHGLGAKLGAAVATAAGFFPEGDVKTFYRRIQATPEAIQAIELGLLNEKGGNIFNWASANWMLLMVSKVLLEKADEIGIEHRGISRTSLHRTIRTQRGAHLRRKKAMPEPV